MKLSMNSVLLRTMPRLLTEPESGTLVLSVKVLTKMKGSHHYGGLLDTSANLQLPPRMIT